MADDPTPAGTQQLEDVETAPAAAEPGAPSAVPQAADVPDKPAEVESVEVGGEKYVPVSALQAERQRRQDLQQKASRVDELEGYVRASQPYVEFLKANPQVMQQRAPEPPATPAEPAADPEALEVAKLMDFYKADGTPDLARAEKTIQVFEGRANRIAQRAVQPLHQSSAQEASTRNYALALNIKDADGRTPDPKILSTFWQAMDPSYTADQAVASILAAAALGAERMQTKSQPAPPTREPVVTESSGGGPRAPAHMTELETRVAQQKGVSASKWSEATKGFNKNRPSPLED